jgi:hypothetical protein
MIGVFASCAVSGLFCGVVHAFFQCGWMHILHEPHLFFALPLVDRGVLGLWHFLLVSAFLVW